MQAYLRSSDFWTGRHQDNTCSLLRKLAMHQASQYKNQEHCQYSLSLMLVPERGHLLDEHNLKSESLLAKKKNQNHQVNEYNGKVVILVGGMSAYSQIQMRKYRLVTHLQVPNQPIYVPTSHVPLTSFTEVSKLLV